MIVSELSRIIDHLVCVCANLVDIGALTNYWYLYNVRESIYQSLEKLCGSRLTTNYARIGGMSHDLYDGFAAEIRAEAGPAARGPLGDVMKLVARNRIFLDRTVGVGVISRADALSFGYTGPCLRATGLDWDLRKHAPYSGYEQYDFDIPTGESGDTHDRIMVRMDEMIQSRSIILQALEKLPDGPLNVDDHRVVLPPKRTVYDSIEGVMNQFKLVYEGIRVPRRRGLRLRRGRQRRAGLLLRQRRQRARLPHEGAAALLPDLLVLHAPDQGAHDPRRGRHPGQPEHHRRRAGPLGPAARKVIRR